MNKALLLTIDVEDWFQVENFKRWIPVSSWPSLEFRVERNTYRLLDLFDSYDMLQTTGNKKLQVTFFVLGWIAERLPNLVREIHARGHEVASHGYNHNLFIQESHKELKKDLTESKNLLEDIIGEPILGYRSPSFSISDDALKIVADCGYLYDSSYNSFGMNKRYGQIESSYHSETGIASQISNTFFELPISNIRLGKYILPWGGGGYFRLIPLPLFTAGVSSILKRNDGYIFYMHPWEIDPDQPRVNKASAFYKFRHYTNLNRTHQKLYRFINKFQKHNFLTCYQYLTKSCVRST